MCQLRQLQTQRNGFKDKYASLFAGVHVHVRSSACLSVSLFVNCDICNKNIGQFQQKIASSVLGKGKLKSLK